MKNALLTVLAFGPLSLSAFAQEGLEKSSSPVSSLPEKTSGLDFTLTSTLIDGNTEIRITKQPEHGSTEITPAINFPTYPKESVRFKCNKHKVRGWQLNYKSAKKYVGSDEFELLVLWPTGFGWEVHYDVSVR